MLTLTGGLGAMVANGSPPSPPRTAYAEWIWHDGKQSDAGQTVYFRKLFSVTRPIQHARLSATTDYADARVMLNGQYVATIESFRNFVDVDLTNAITAGDNLLALQANSDPGPSALALELQLEFADGTTQFLVSDPTWRTGVTPFDGWKEAAAPSPANWNPAISTGRAEPVRIGTEIELADITPFDDYTQWKQALHGSDASSESSYRVTPGFEIELVRAAANHEDSWVSLVFDPQGRVIIAREKRGLLRLTLDADGKPLKVETIDDSLEECRGLLFVEHDLWVNANNSKGLYRLRDTDGDHNFDARELIYASMGDVGHGRNDLAFGPDKRVYSIHGDSVRIPHSTSDFTSPPRHVGLQQSAGEGHVICIDPTTKQVSLVVAGLRNPYGIDFHRDGGLFTYDADAEFDMGAPWYRPTRVLDLLRGGDYAWRAVTGDWPPYSPDRADAAPPNLDIGKGSPTAVKFGYASNFPPPYHDALYVLDWAYGRVLAVHLEPWGASYAMRAETFLRGRPLNVTDIAFGPDGSMYLTTGGRQTQSGLYRVRYTESAPSPRATASLPVATLQQQRRREQATLAREIRRQLEATLENPSEQGAELAWKSIDERDPWLRHTARQVIERQPLQTWANRAVSAPFLETKLALARFQSAEHQVDLLASLNEFSWQALSPSARLRLLRAYELTFSTKPDRLSPELIQQAHDRLLSWYPDEEFRVNQQLGQMLATLSSPALVAPTMQLMRQSKSQQEQMYFLYLLRNLDAVWTHEDRVEYFRALRQCDSYVGGEGMPGFLKRIREEALATVPDGERAAMTELLANPLDLTPEPTVVDRPFVHAWQAAELLTHLQQLSAPRDYNRGRQMFDAALCSRCHRVGELGKAYAPDLTSVQSRFARRDILQSILAPSDVIAEPYQWQVVTTTQGQTIVGRAGFGTDYRSEQLHIVTNLLDPERRVSIPKSEVETYTKSDISPMPSGLLNTLTADEILDLFAFLESGGNSRHPIFGEHRGRE